ncbi:MAG: hypothetical protein U0232_11900 [Thermomicrobiales bacterium]
MRVLLLLGAERERPGRESAMEGVLAAALRSAGVEVGWSRAVNPVLDECDLVHIITVPPSEHAVRQFIHARRWGKAVVLSPAGWEATGEAAEAPERYERGLRDLLARGAERVVVLDGTAQTGLRGYAVTEVPHIEDPAFGAAMARVYGAARQEFSAMVERDGEGGRWVPTLSAEDYGKHLEDLVQLQLELIAYRDAEYEHLRRESEASASDRQGDYARLEAWSRELEAQHAALQAEHERLQRWASELEAQVRAAGEGGARANIARLLRRR